MGFWNDSRTFDTKRAFRWMAYFNGADAWMVKSVSKPSLSISETSHRFINHTYYYPGRAEWNTISLVLIDPMSPDGVKSIMHLLEASGYNPNITTAGPFNTISKSKAVAAMQQLEIKQLDAEGNTVEAWKLRHAWVKDAKFGDLSYDRDELLDITLTIRYDWAELWTNPSHDTWLQTSLPDTVTPAPSYNMNFPSDSTYSG
jgi:hypothetical protein